MTGQRGKTPSDEELIADSRSTVAERRVQPAFTVLTLAGCLLLLLTIDFFVGWLARLPDRRELGERVAELRLDPVRVSLDGDAPFRVAGAWKVSSDDPRVGGVSALALDSGALVALTDRGSLIRFPRPSRERVRATIRELPSGPRSGEYNAYRDSEAIIADPAGRGWWVAFEHVDELWLFDQPIRRALQRVDLRPLGMRSNYGIEALASDGSDLLLFAEDGRRLIRMGRPRPRLERSGSGPPISDAAKIGGGKLVAIERRLTPLGFANSLVLLGRTGEGYATARQFRIRASPLDNFEAIAVDRSAGGTRLWLMTDDGFDRPFRTLIVAIDVRE